jgi:hypothetical protein
MIPLIPSVPFEGYKLSHIQALEKRREFNFERKDTLEKFHFILSLHPFILEILNSLFNPQALHSLGWITSLSPLYELAFGGGLKWWRPSWRNLVSQF